MFQKMTHLVRTYLMNTFGPRWKHSDPEQRLRAIDQLISTNTTDNSEAFLCTIATSKLCDCTMVSRVIAGARSFQTIERIAARWPYDWAWKIIGQKIRSCSWVNEFTRSVYEGELRSTGWRVEHGLSRYSGPGLVTEELVILGDKGVRYNNKS